MEFFKYLDEIKEYESEPKVFKNVFTSKEIYILINHYKNLPDGAGGLRPYSKKQSVKKKLWEAGINKDLDSLYVKKIKKLLGKCRMDNRFSENITEKNYYGLFHESFKPLNLHVDTGKNPENIIYKQALIPLTSLSETILFEPRWYGPATSFSIDPKVLNSTGYNERSSEHIGDEVFDKDLHKKYLTHEDINNLTGLKIKFIYEWSPGDVFIFDRTFPHCSSNFKGKKIGLTSFFSK